MKLRKSKVLADNLFLGVPYLLALIQPERYIYFIQITGIMLAMAEMINIGAIVIVADRKNDSPGNLIYFFFYLILSIYLIGLSGNIFILLFLVTSLYTKFFQQKGVPSKEKTIKYIFSLVISVIAAVWATIFVYLLIGNPLDSVNNNTWGGLREYYLLVLLWGIIYPITLIIIEFIKPKFLQIDPKKKVLI